MKSDRELLELAAKAAGYRFKWFKVKQWKEMKSKIGTYRYCTGTVEVYGHHHSKPWNPLTDDGDALRLAVKCGICFGSGAVSRRPRVAWWQCGQMNSFDMPEGDGLRRPQNWTEWTRRAIVLAAAAIGEAM